MIDDKHNQLLQQYVDTTEYYRSSTQEQLDTLTGTYKVGYELYLKINPTITLLLEALQTGPVDRDIKLAIFNLRPVIKETADVLPFDLCDSTRTELSPTDAELWNRRTHILYDLGVKPKIRDGLKFKRSREDTKLKKTIELIEIEEVFLSSILLRYPGLKVLPDFDDIEKTIPYTKTCLCLSCFFSMRGYKVFTPMDATPAV